MKVVETHISDVLILEPEIFEDNRGFFYEGYNKQKFAKIIGSSVEMVQENYSYSVKNVLRGLHYQLIHPQGKLVSVVSGEVFDVAVDLRKNSPNFKQWVGTILTSQSKRLFWIPKGFAHGFVVLSENAELLYKTTDFYDPVSEKSIRWDDPELAIPWPMSGEPVLSEKDRKGSLLREAEVYTRF
ncbi:MAG: dTDP-4-dehydrorhamnose 3,5-epimerase [Chlamydiae bacterium]|nr:dTDP-4-dehydrorhamnose 3,5-epimerase [Chlamydiota bacterium]